MLTVLLALNLIAAFASAAWAAVALWRPSLMSGAIPGAESRFYVRMYAARSIPFGVAVGLLPFSPGGPAVAWVLFTASLIQVADAVIAAAKRDRGMMAGATIGALVHAACGWAIL